MFLKKLFLLLTISFQIFNISAAQIENQKSYSFESNILNFNQMEDENRLKFFNMLQKDIISKQSIIINSIIDLIKKFCPKSKTDRDLKKTLLEFSETISKKPLLFKYLIQKMLDAIDFAIDEDIEDIYEVSETPDDKDILLDKMEKLKINLSNELESLNYLLQICMQAFKQAELIDNKINKYISEKLKSILQKYGKL